MYVTSKDMIFIYVNHLVVSQYSQLTALGKNVRFFSSPKLHLHEKAMCRKDFQEISPRTGQR